MAGRQLARAFVYAVVLCSCASERERTDADAASTTESDASGTEVETSTTEVETADGTSYGPTSEATDLTDATTDTATDVTGGPTTGPDAVCGNGQVERGEECDDDNEIDDDGCNTMCFRDRVVFVSSELRQGDFGSVSGANSLCRALASEAGLPNADTYRAWLADSDESPDSKFFKSWGRYVRVDGVQVAANYMELTDGEIDAPIRVDEAGNELEFSPLVWTNTATDGTTHPDSQHCLDWSTSDFFTNGRHGLMNYVNANEWYDAEMNNPAPCGIEGRFYCFEN